MAWNYRVVRYRKARPDDWLAVHSAFYNDGVPPDGKPHSISVTSIAPQGESLDELKSDLEKMQRALELPILDYDDF